MSSSNSTHAEEKAIASEQNADPQAQKASPPQWDGDDDPDNPYNWSTFRKTVNVGIVCTLAFLTPLASSAITPGVPLIDKEFGNTNTAIAACTISIFVLGFAFGPLILSPCSEIYGRRIVYNVSNIVFLAFTIACAVAPSIASFIGFRFLCGVFGAAPMNIGGGTIADQIRLESRGRIMSVLFTGIFLGPVIGPVIGGFLAQGAGWRWVFWLLTIVSGVMTVASFLFLSESYAPIILSKRAKSRAKEQGLEHFEPAKAANAKAVFLRSIARPMRMLIYSPIVTGLSLYLAVIYGYLYLLFTTFSTVFPGQYNFNTGILGLAFLGLGMGIALGLAVLASISDKIQLKLTEKHGVSKPEYRLLPLVIGIPLLPTGLFVYGWTAQYKVHWIVPIIFTGFTGAGLIFSFVPTQIYMVDAFTKYAASALAATSVVRSIFGGTLPLAGDSMYKALGYGWGNSLLGFVALALSVAPLAFWKYGEKMRTEYDVSFD